MPKRQLNEFRRIFICKELGTYEFRQWMYLVSTDVDLLDHGFVMYVVSDQVCDTLGRPPPHITNDLGVWLRDWSCKCEPTTRRTIRGGK